MKLLWLALVLLLQARPLLVFPANENLMLLSFLFYMLAEVFTPALRNPGGVPGHFRDIY